MAEIETPPVSPSAYNVRSPAVVVAFALAAGIVVDRYASPSGLGWVICGLVVAAAACLCRVVRGGRWSPTVTTAAVLVLWTCLGGWRHHAVHDLRKSDNITTMLSSPRAPARLIARLETAAVIDAADHSSSAPTWTQVDRTVALVACEAIGDVSHELPVSGRVRLEVSGHLIGPRIGDRLELVGVLQRPSGPLNPGGFDYAEWLRRSGIDATFRVEHPDHVRILESQPTWLDQLGRFRDRLRRAAEWVFIQRLDYAEVPLATSLLLGDRSGLDPVVAEQFAQSGTMHLLAISGLHVGILAGLVHLMCRLAGCRTGTTTALLLLTVVGYALVTDQRPPVLRAALLAVIVLAARRWRREAGGYQSLAVCALLVLLYRPMDLFDAGAQLSFVAVLGILWSSRWQAQRDTNPELDALPEARSRWGRWWDGLWSWLRPAYILTGTIWLFTLPLTAWHFNLCSPIGLLINVVLIPITTAMLAAGYLMLPLGLAHPVLAIAPAFVFQLLLSLLLTLVEWCGTTALGHMFVPPPPDWWLAGFYLLLAWATQLVRCRWRSGWGWRGLSVWTIGGLVLGLVPTQPAGLRVTFLAVGHGCAVLVEAPGGRTLLFDAGSFVDGRRAQRAISAAMWSRGLRRIDVATVSHADVDHFNGLPSLTSVVPVGSILLTAVSLDFRQEAMVDLCESAAKRGVPLRLIQAGDRLELDPEVECEVLHPTHDFRAAEDNANSLVLRLRYGGRTVFLTGDLEGAGLDRLLSLPAERVDVLLSPHHGSRAANPPQLAAWAQPRLVVSSSAGEESQSQLVACYPATTSVLSTAISGAITVLISEDGHMDISPFVSPERKEGAFSAFSALSVDRMSPLAKFARRGTWKVREGWRE